MSDKEQSPSNSIDIETQKKVKEYRYKSMRADLKKAAINAIYNSMSPHARLYDREKYPDADIDIFMTALELIHIIREAEIKFPK